MKKIMLIIVMLISLSCKKQGGVIIDTEVYLHYKNANGDNLLNANTPASIQANDLSVYELIKGVKTSRFDANMDNPKGFSVYASPDKGNILRFSFSYQPDARVNNKVMMFIRYKDGSEDKFTGEFNDSNESSVIVKKIWVNDVLRWERQQGGSPGMIELIK
jgi:hypothetical protein